MSESNTTTGHKSNNDRTAPLENASVEAKTALQRLQIIKNGLQYKKLAPRAINYDIEDEEEQQTVETETVTDASHGSSNEQKCVISLADLSAYSMKSLESAELGSFNKAEIISKSLSSTGKKVHRTKKPPKVCQLCSEEYDAHDYVCLSKNIKCTHMFHAKCMIRYLMENGEKCPTCHELYLIIE